MQENSDYIRRIGEDHPVFENGWGSPDGSIDLVPKPVSGKLALLVTGGSQQDPDWIARNGDGWDTHPCSIASATGWPRSVSGLTASILNLSVKRCCAFFVSISTLVKPRG